MKVHLAILICISFQVVLSEQVASCELDSECRVLNTCSNNECVHKELIPLESLDIVGGLVILVLAGLANAGGMGGGPLMTSSILLILSFETHQAIPLAQIIVAGGSFVAVSLKFTQKHPKRNRPLINYTILMHIQSPLLLGTTFGVILNRGFPEWLIIFLLTALLVFATFKTARKGIKLYKSESLNKVDQEEPDEEADGENNQLTAARELNNGSSVSPELQAIYDSEKKTIPLVPAVIIFSVLGLVILSSLLRGFIGAEECTLESWLIIGGVAILLVTFSIITARLVVQDSLSKYDLGYDFDEDDLIWDYRKAAKIGVGAFLAGLGAGLLGMGGGTIMSPLLLSLGVLPEVTAASCSFMVFFTSSAAVVQFGVAGEILFDYGAFLFTMSVVGSLCGVLLVKKIVNRSNRSSLIVLALGGALGLASVIIPTYGVINVVDQLESGNTQFGFQDFC